MILEIWREWLLAALDWRYIVPLVAILTTCFIGDQIYDHVQEGKAAVAEVIHLDTKPTPKYDVAKKYVPPVKALANQISDEQGRVLLL
jgi:hypothetical protein